MRARQVDGLRELVVLQRIVERHQLGARFSEDLGQPHREGRIGTLVRPQPENTSRLEVGGQPAKTLGAIESGVSRVEQEVRRMIDIDQDGS